MYRSRQERCFSTTFTEGNGYFKFRGIAHLVESGHYERAWMRLHTHAEILGGMPVGMHASDILAQFSNDHGHMPKPPLDLRIHPDSAKILIAWPIAKPSPHLEQCVIRFGVAQKIADAQPFQRQAARECEATNRDNSSTFFSITILGVVQPVGIHGFLVDSHNLDGCNGTIQIFSYRIPRDVAVTVLFLPCLVQLFQSRLCFPQAVCSQILLDVFQQAMKLVPESVLSSARTRSASPSA